MKSPANQKTAFISVFFILSLFIFILPVEGTNDPFNFQGFRPEQTYDIYGDESINVFNGNLTISQPCSPKYTIDGGMTLQLMRTYNIPTWKYLNEPPGGYSDGYLQDKSPAGLGWTMHLGRILLEDRTFDNMAYYQFITPDGAKHELEEIKVGPEETVYRTTDSTYYRVIFRDNVWTVNSRDGITYTLSEYLADEEEEESWDGWYTTQIEDTSGNRIEVEYTYFGGHPYLQYVDIVDGPNGDNQRRVIKIHYTNQGINDVLPWHCVDYIECRGFDGHTAGNNNDWVIYNFAFIKHNVVNTPPPDMYGIYLETNIDAAFLVAVDLPKWDEDGNQYVGFEYEYLGDMGLLDKMTYPTGSYVEYELRAYDYPFCFCEEYFKRDSDPDQAEEHEAKKYPDEEKAPPCAGFWRTSYKIKDYIWKKRLNYKHREDSQESVYEWKYDINSTISVTPEFTTVTDPNGNKTIYRFKITPFDEDDCPSGWYKSTDTLNEEIEYYRGGNKLVQEVFMVHKQDNDDPDDYNEPPKNPRLERMETVYHDENDQVAGSHTIT